MEKTQKAKKVKASQNKAKDVESTKKELSIHDRLMILGLLPREGDFVTLKLARDIREKVELSQAEMKKHDVKPRSAEDGGGLQWIEPKKKTKIDFSSAEMELLKAKVSELDKTKKIRSEILSLCEMIRGS